MDSRVLQTKVHFFEHVSIEKFAEYLNSALQYVTNILFDRVPTLVRFRYWQDEIIFLIDNLLQVWYLKKYGATYAEHYYGYKRGFNGSIFPILLVTCIKRYIRKKIEKKIQKEDSLLSKILKASLLLIDLSSFFLQINYLLLPNSEYYSLSFYILKQKLLHPNEESQNSFLGTNFPLILFLGTKLLDNMMMPKISEERNLVFTKAPLKYRSGERYCPVCKKEWRNATVLAVSGVVGCFGCLEEYVDKNGVCPITGRKCGVDNMHRIFRNNS